MVQNKNNILDAGQNKFVPDIIMSNKKYVEHEIVRKFLICDRKTLNKTVMDPITFEKEEILIDNPDYIEPTDRYANFKKVFFDPVYTSVLKDEYRCWGVDDYYTVRLEFGWQKILDYMGIIPFTPSVMINVSPHWKNDKYIWHKKEALKFAMEHYLNECNRYDYWSCVIECGSEGNFVHAHAVAHVNPKMLRSVIGDGRPKGDKDKSHIGKGNHKDQIGKHICAWFREYEKSDKCPRNFIDNFEKSLPETCKGIKGLLKGSTKSVDRCICRHPDLTRDKLDYLVEEKKPDGHKNMVVSGFPLLFTSKDITES